jgi:chorismate mutase
MARGFFILDLYQLEENMPVRGIRGATTVSEDTGEAIRLATRELLLAICAANPFLRPADIASVFFTTTDDVRAAYPAQAARELGWETVPLMDAQEIPVPGSLPRCIRVMILWNTELAQQEIHPVYLREAVRLRPDLAKA